MFTGEREMGLLDALKNMMGDQPASKAAPAPVQPQTKSAPAPIKTESAPKDQIRAKFGDKMPYYDSEFGALEVSFNGFAEVKSESWAKDPKGDEFIASIITTTIKKEIMALGNQKVSYKDLSRNINTIRQACNEALKEKGIEPVSVSIATINLTPESREQVKKAQG